MTPERFLRGRVQLYNGDCRAALRALADASIDSCVTDPPYHLTSIVERFGNEAPSNMHEPDHGRVTRRAPQYKRLARGFMGKQWDGGDIAFRPELWAEVYRVLKPGAHLLAFGGTRTYHRLVCAIEDAGFEVRDSIIWAYGSGFPKSHDVSKGIDATLLHGGSGSTQRKRANDARPGPGRVRARTQNHGIVVSVTNDQRGGRIIKDTPSTPEGEQWAGWGTALKPAVEIICLARKPLSEKTVAKNVLKHGTGAINIRVCRIEGDNPTIARRAEARRRGTAPTSPGTYSDHQIINRSSPERYMEERADEVFGRWPANLIHDGSAEVVAAFPDAGSAGNYPSESVARDGATSFQPTQGNLYADSGSAARFYYSAKADIDDRLALKHPTVKPVDLIAYLVKLVTPPGGTVLDPFAGTGTAAEAAYYQGMQAILIEREAEYQGMIRERLRIIRAGGYERLLVKNQHRARDAPPRPGQFF